MQFRKLHLTLLSLSFCSFFCSAPVRAAIINTADLSGSLNQEYYYDSTLGGLEWIVNNTDAGSSGNGVISAFLNIQASPDEEGFNSTRAMGQFDEKNMKQGADPNTSGTRGLARNEVPTGFYTGKDGTLPNDEYGQFLFDGGESGGSKLLTIDQIQIFAADSTTALATDLTATLADTTDMSGIPIMSFTGAEEVFRLSDDLIENLIIVDSSLGAGNGTFDMRFYFDLDLLDALDPDVYTHLIFYTHISGTDGTYEQWAVSDFYSVFDIPEPSTWALLMMTAAGALFFQYRKQRKQKLAMAEATNC